MFTDVQINLGAGGPGKFRLKYEVDKFEPQQSQGCVSGWSDEDLSSVVNAASALLTSESQDFQVTVKTKLLLVQQPGSEPTEQPLSTARRVMVNQPLGQIQVHVVDNCNRTIDITTSEVAVEMKPIADELT